jgi:hypothetical protein
MGYDVTEKFSVGGVLAGAWQYLQADEDAAGEDVDDGSKGFNRPFQMSRLKPGICA